MFNSRDIAASLYICASSIRMTQYTCTIHIFIILILLSECIPPLMGQQQHVNIHVNTTIPVHITRKTYLSLGMDSNLIRNEWQTWDFTSTRLKTLAQALAPAYLRLCGTDADRMFFWSSKRSDQASWNKAGSLKQSDRMGWKKSGSTMRLEKRYDRSIFHMPELGGIFPESVFTMSNEDWDNINKFASTVGWKIMFCFNGQVRNGSTWDPSNARELLKYSHQHGYSSNLDFELGNEPDSYSREKYFEALTPEQLAADFTHLRTLLNTDFDGYFRNCSLRGPGLGTSRSVAYLSQFLKHIPDNVLDAVTWHQYYGGGELNNTDNYTDPDILDSYTEQCDSVVQTVRSSGHRTPIWLGETSSTYFPPGTGIDMTYVAGFMLLDKLGVSARCGMELVIRQTFYGFWFALVDEKLLPTPNYWVALLYRQLVGNYVLDIYESVNASKYIRTYANCINKLQSFDHQAVVVYGMNLHTFNVTVDLSSLGRQVYEYIFAPAGHDLLSTNILLNGQLLRVTEYTSIPDLLAYGRPVKEAHNINLQTRRFVFYVVNDAKAVACSSTNN